MKMRLTLEDIPEYTWENVLEKWDTVRLWKDDLWKSCALCRYCGESSFREKGSSIFSACDCCPLPITYSKNNIPFCVGSCQESALCFKEGESVEAWQDNVREFCDLVHELIHKKYLGEKN